MKPNIKCTWIAVIAAVAVSLTLGTALRAAPLPGAIFTTDSTCSGVDLNIYGDKHEVYLDGGPSHPGAASLPDGSYYVQVTDPSGHCVLGTSVGAGNQTPFVVTNGVAQCIQLCAVLINGPDPSCALNGADPNCGYMDTTNPGGEYKVWVSTESSFTNSSTKTDNFKVAPGGGTPQTATLCVLKFYDANVNGFFDPGEQQIQGWQYDVFADNNLIIQSQTYHCSVVDPGTYHVFEGTPVETNWLHTTPVQVDITLAANDTQTAQFGNVCLGAGGGLTLGFWSNRNGQSLETAADFTFLTGLNLRNATGGNQDFTSGNLATNKSALHDWLLNGTAVNMAYMLSVQLAAMELNVRHNPPSGVTGGALVYGGDCVKYYQQKVPAQLPGSNGFITISDLMTAANTELGLHGLTPSGNQFRAFQECMKTTLDNANNNLNFVESSPCPFTFPTP